MKLLKAFAICCRLLFSTELKNPCVKPYYTDSLGSKSIGEPHWKPHGRNAASYSLEETEQNSRLYVRYSIRFYFPAQCILSQQIYVFWTFASATVKVYIIQKSLSKNSFNLFRGGNGLDWFSSLRCAKHSEPAVADFMTGNMPPQDVAKRGQNCPTTP